ncbi:ATP-binding cassette sub-family C member 2-like isoform X2 [Topomyia yanbarensis]|uniref:ATP-binding cassette sub-family C member 2-like isoform X2 n=1 Tax=Topomyia yanbarensis TaxID=2498891 RepID=UPI00273C7DAC|nr:ATP-binding cassette sub-family C member 2-like isoform X2 [Topomyia yanbarensis]
MYFVTLMLLQLGTRYNVRDQTFLLLFWMLDLLINSIRVVERLLPRNFYFIGILLTLLVLLWYTNLDNHLQGTPTISPNLIRSISFSWFGTVNRKIHQSKFDELGELESQLRSGYLIKYFRTGTAPQGQYEAVSLKDAAFYPQMTMWRLLKPFGRDLLWSGLNRLTLTVLFFVCPVLLRQILRNDYQNTPSENHVYVICIFIVSLVIAALNGQYMYETQRIGLKIKSLLLVMIYEKSLKMRSSSNSDVTLLTLDSSRFVDLLPNLHLLWSGPIIITISVAGLLVVLGKSALIGVFVMILTITLTKKITDKLRLLQKDLMDRKDPRIASTNEAIGMMKQIKYACWEGIFQQRILQYRQREIQMLRWIVYWDAPKYLLGVISPFLVSLATFGLMIAIGDAPLLMLDSVFVSIVLFNILKYPLSMLPVLSTTWTATQASVDRINRFLHAEEIRQPLDQKNKRGLTNLLETIEHVLGVCRKALDTPVVSTHKASFSSEGKQLLHAVDLQVSEGSFTIITGPVGSGKSSLLTAMLGELELVGGTFGSTVGQIGYVSQEPWILHRTLLENIVFGEVFDQELFDKVIQFCGLGPDLEMLPNGPKTLIGEKGVTVSGGQKQRIALARAVYQKAELYLFDDPLSSVDEEVSQYIYGKLLAKGGLLEGKTVVMVTQNQEHFGNADSVLVMENGAITGRYTYEAYREKYPREHLANKNEIVDADLKVNSLSEDHPVAEKRSNLSKSGKVSYKTYSKYLGMLGWFHTVVIVALNIAFSVCDIFSTIWLSQWTLIDHKTSISEDAFYLIIYSLLILGLAIFLLLSSTLTTVRGTAVAEQLHSKLLHNTIHLPMTFFDKVSSGQIMNRFSTDLDVVDCQISLNIRDFFTSSSSVISILVLFCFNTSYYLVIILAVIVAIYYYLLVYHLETSRQLKHLEADSISPLILHFNESREGRSTIRAYRQEDWFLSDFMTIVDRHQHYSNLYLASSRWLGVRLEIIGSVVIYFVTMLAVQNQATTGASNVGVSISYALRLIPLLNALVRVSALLEENATSLERIDQYLEERNELKLAEDHQQVVGKSWPDHGRIEFVNFSMDYSERNPALQEVSMVIHQKEKIGIVGRTGAGKSSLVSALFRLYPTQTTGVILIDGVNIDRVALSRLRRSLSIIPQNPLLFAGTVRENLDPNGIQTDDSELWHALDRCYLKQLIAKLPEQLDTAIDECNSKLSVGEKQLLCLARGILQKSKIVILDEATSNMDLETESTVQKVIQSTFQNCTVLTIAHRMNTIELVDRVLHMRNGRVVKLDTPQNFNDVDLVEL